MFAVGAGPPNALPMGATAAVSCWTYGGFVTCRAGLLVTVGFFFKDFSTSLRWATLIPNVLAEFRLHQSAQVNLKSHNMRLLADLNFSERLLAALMVAILWASILSAAALEI